MPRLDQQTVLDVLTRARLLEIALSFALDVSTRTRKSDLTDLLARSRRSPMKQILESLRREELKAICRVAEVDDSGREKAPLVDRILRQGLRLAPRGSLPEVPSETLTKAELVTEVVDTLGISRAQAEAVVAMVLQSLTEALQDGEAIELRGFGSFGVRQRRPRMGRNPKTGEQVSIPAKRVPFFKPGKALKDLLNP